MTDAEQYEHFVGVSAAPVLSSFEVAADELRAREFTRLSAAVVPTVDALRLLTGHQLRARVATMLERLGHELLTPEMAANLVTTKDGKKYVVAFASMTDLAPTPLGDLARLHAVVVTANAAAGIFITPRGFTLDAEAYAATAPVKLVDGLKLVASIKRSMEGATMPDSYQAMCRQCGEIVTHTLDRAEAIPCGSTVPNGGANEFVYDQQGRLLGEYSSTGTIVEETVWLPATPISAYLGGYGASATPVAVQTGTAGATVYSVTADWLNAPHIIANSSKQLVWTWDHYAFGDNGPNQNPAGLGVFTYNLRFPGQYADAETGLSYNYFRDYNYKLGRYIESDPIGLGGGINTYQFVKGHPSWAIDPFGLADGPGGISYTPVPPAIPVTNQTFGLGGQIFVLAGGLSGSTSFGYDSVGNICVTGEVCSSVGLGLSASSGGSVTKGEGELCSGRSTSVSVSVDGGDGYFAGLAESYANDPTTNGFGIFALPPVSAFFNSPDSTFGYGGAGAGVSVSINSCTQPWYRTLILNPLISMS